MPTTPVYLEIADKRTFACSLQWPGWTRAGKTEDEAMEALVDAAPRYRRTVGSAARDFTAPKTAKGLRVVELVKGNATTEFGAPGVPAKADDENLTEREVQRQLKVLQACWRAIDKVVDAAVGVELRKGPRGGGRDLDKIVEHVNEAERAYLSKLGGLFKPERGASPADVAKGLRAAVIEAATLRVRGEPAPKPPPKSAMWPVAYSIRRSAWHAIDHVWEIEDRSA